MPKKKRVFLSEKEKSKIYKLFTENNLSQKELSNHFSCSLSTVKNTITNYNSTIYQKRVNLKKNGVKEPISFTNEVWKKISYPTKTIYEVSNLGRIRSYFPNPGKPVILNGILQMGYLFFDHYNKKLEKKLKIPFHTVVADHFCKKSSPAKNTIIHVDHNKTNNRASNLQWVNKVEFNLHHKKNPLVIASIKRVNDNRTKGAKLNLIQVERIRKMLADPERKITKRRIAQMFGVSEMAIYRIQSGENWGNKGKPIQYKKKIILKLPDEKLKRIRKKLNEKNAVQTSIAKEFGLSPAIINRIKTGKTYKRSS